MSVRALRARLRNPPLSSTTLRKHSKTQHLSAKILKITAPESLKIEPGALGSLGVGALWGHSGSSALHSKPLHSKSPHSKPPHSKPPHSKSPHSKPPHSKPPHSKPPHSKPPHWSISCAASPTVLSTLIKTDSQRVQHTVAGWRRMRL